ncbi:MAG: sensor domain-containing diguanylate cyclase [Spirochaetes bacterium]|nr:sensor domain-containing diguanylate cyclase [Spirochaetota bacterium]
MELYKIDSDLDMQQSTEIYERKIYDLMQLIEICKGLNSTLIDSNKLIESILLTCMGQMQLIKAGIFLKKDIDQNVFILHRNYKGFELDHTTEYEIEGDSSFIYFLENNFKCYELIELVDIFDDSPVINTMRLVSPSLIIPLKGKDKLNGIIVLGERINNETFTPDEKEYLMHIASLAGIAIHNAYLYEMATTDMMTKLKSHHFFQTSLIEEREKAVRNNTALSLIMFDIDHFKDFNDKHGHVCGDIVLKNVGKKILEKIRQIDIASRYGGEEFVVILPETGIEEAHIIAERIRVSIEELRVEYSGQIMSITLSGGVTQFLPYLDKDNLTFINRADKALYLSKERGRNRTTIL